MLEEGLSKRIIGAFFDVYNTLGFGFNEQFYANAFAVELQALDIPFSREVPIEVVYRGVPVGTYRLDMVVSNRLIVEMKSTREISAGDERQLLSYLKASSFELGFLLHFGPEAKSSGSPIRTPASSS
jgi:GxxExxY protein